MGYFCYFFNCNRNTLLFLINLFTAFDTSFSSSSSSTRSRRRSNDMLSRAFFVIRSMLQHLMTSQLYHISFVVYCYHTIPCHYERYNFFFCTYSRGRVHQHIIYYLESIMFSYSYFYQNFLFCLNKYIWSVILNFYICFNVLFILISALSFQLSLVKSVCSLFAFLNLIYYK